MLSPICPDLRRQKSFHIKQDDKFFSKLLSKETSAANPSFRVYYGDVSGAVPFTWETRPGTPKHTLSDASLPPLTPPPAYYFRSPKESTMKHPRSKLLNALLTRITVRKKSHVPFSPSCSSSWSSLSWSSSHSSFSAGPMTTKSNFHGRRGFSSSGSSFNDGPGNDHQEMFGGSSTFCFGLRRGRRSAALRGGNSATTMKKTLLSIIGRRSD